jgi:hypothetical protein
MSHGYAIHCPTQQSVPECETPRIFQDVRRNLAMPSATQLLSTTRGKASGMRQIVLAPMGIAVALILAPHAGADPTSQAVQLDNISYPHCVIQADRVICLGGAEWPQKVAFVASSGEFKWGSGSSLSGGQPLPLTQGQTYHWLGWTVATSRTDMTFTNDVTSHGMTVNNGNASPF